MKTLSVTEVARNFRAVLDRITHRQEEIGLVRNRRQVARLVPECRLVYTENTRLLTSFGWKRPPKHFRTRADVIIPYARLREIGISSIRTPEKWECKRLPLREIVVGPQERSDVVVNGVRDFLAEKDYRNVAVRQSSIPFR